MRRLENFYNLCPVWSLWHLCCPGLLCGLRVCSKCHCHTLSLCCLDPCMYPTCLHCVFPQESSNCLKIMYCTGLTFWGSCCVVCMSVLSVIATPSVYAVWTLALGLSLALFLWWNHLHFQATKGFSSTDINL